METPTLAIPPQTLPFGTIAVDAAHQQAALARIEAIKQEVAQSNDDNLIRPVPLFTTLAAKRL